MQYALLFTFVALATSTPLGWSGIGGRLVPGSNSLWQLTSSVQPPPQIGQQIAQQGKVAAQQTAEQIVQQALKTRQDQTVQGIQQLQQQLQQQQLQGNDLEQQIKQITTVNAIQQLKKQLQFQQAVAPQIVGGSPLAKTLEVVIGAQLATGNVVGPAVGVFQAKVKQLVDSTNIQEIQGEIVRQQVKTQELEQQQQFVSLQKQQIQLQQQIQGQQQQQLVQAAVLDLEQQEQRLVVEIVARQLVIEQLEGALVGEQQLLEQDFVTIGQQQQLIGNQLSGLANYYPTGNQVGGPYSIWTRGTFGPKIRPSYLRQPVWAY